MSPPKYQQKIGSFSLLSAAAIFLLVVMQTETGVKFPATGPNELLLVDTGMACLIAYYCSCYYIVQHHGKILVLTLFRLIIFCYVAISIYSIQAWYRTHKSGFMAVVCWGILGIHMAASFFSILWTVYFMYTEQLFANYNWRAIKTYFVGDSYHVSPPEYTEASTDSSMPPTYEEAIAARPPGYTEINTQSDTSVVHISNDLTSVRFSRIEMESSDSSDNDDNEEEGEESGPVFL